MRFEEMKLEETREVNGGKSITTKIPRGSVTKAVLLKYIGKTVIEMGVTVASKIF